MGVVGSAEKSHLSLLLAAAASLALGLGCFGGIVAGLEGAAVGLGAVLVFLLLLKPSWALYAMLVFVPIEESLYLGEWTIAKAFALVLFASWGLNFLRTGRLQRLHLSTVLFLVWGFWNVLTLFWSVDKEVAVGYLPTLLGLLGFLFVSAQVLRSEETWRWAAISYVVGAILAATYALYCVSALRFGLLPSTFVSEAAYEGLTQSGRLAISSIGPMHLGIALVGPLLLVLVLGILSLRGVSRTLAIVVAFLLSAVLAVTVTRQAYIGLLVALLVLTLRRRKFLLAGFVFASFSVSLWIGLAGETVHLRLVEAIDRSAQTRFTLWKTGVEMGKDNLLTGVGLANSPLEFDNYYVQQPGVWMPPDIQDVHSTYLTIFAETGLPGLTFFLLGLLFLGKDLRSVAKRPGRVGAIAEVAALALLAYVTMGFFTNILSRKYFWSMVALGTAAVTIGQKKTTTRLDAAIPGQEVHAMDGPGLKGK